MDKRSPSQLTALALLNTAYSSPLNPLSSTHFQNFVNFCHEKSINLPENFVKTRQCFHCGSLYIPGLTVSIRVTFKRRKSTPRRRLLAYKCLRCDHTQSFEGLLMPKGAKKLLSPKFVATWPQVKKEVVQETTNARNEKLFNGSKQKKSQNGPEVIGSSRSNKNSLMGKSALPKGPIDTPNGSKSNGSVSKPSLLARQRSKKRKENSLMSIINRKKEEEPKSLNLMDFMK